MCFVKRLYFLMGYKNYDLEISLNLPISMPLKKIERDKILIFKIRSQPIPKVLLKVWIHITDTILKIYGIDRQP